MIEFYDWGRGVVPTRETAGLPLLFCVISKSVSRPAEVRPWEVRFAHPCRAHARHPIHKAMGGHASHGRTSDRAFVRLGWSVSPNTSRRRQKKRPGNTPRPLNNVRATETATDVSILPREMSRSDRGVRDREALSVSPNTSRGRKKRDRGTLLDLLITCERRDSNPYARRHQILSLAWLPITTRSQIPSGRLIT